jgi:hypothetical protein
MKRVALSLWLLITSAAALAQPVTSVGPPIPGDCAMFASTTVIKDAGFPCPGAGGTLNLPAGTTFGGPVVLPNGSTATTQSAADNTTKVATDAFVGAAISAQTTHFAAGGTTTGSANAQVIAATSPPVFSLTGNPTVSFVAGFSNSGATTLNVVSTGATNILRKTSAGLVALATGDLIAGQQYLATYDGAKYELQEPSSNINQVFTSSTPGWVPPSTGGAVKFLRADGAFNVPPTFGSAAPGYVPASGGGTANFLRADATFAPTNAMPNVYIVENYGAKADLITHADGAITAATATFNSASATFSSADIGKIISIAGAGASGAVLFTTIAAYGGNPTQVSLQINASTTVSGASYNYSTDSTPGIQNAVGFAENGAGGDVQFNSGSYGVTSVNMTNPNRPIRVLGLGPLSGGTNLVAMSNVTAVLDATGHDAIQIANIQVSSGVAVPGIGLLVSPSAAIHGIDVIRVENVRITGFFGTAAFYMDRIYGGTFINTSSFQYSTSAQAGFVMTGTNVSGVSSAFTTTCSATCNGTIGSFTFVRSEFHDFSTAPNRPSMAMDNVVDSTWISGLVSGNGSTIVLGAGCVGLTFMGTQFSADNTTINYVFSSAGANFVVTINTNSSFTTSFSQTALTNLTQIGRI